MDSPLIEHIDIHEGTRVVVKGKDDRELASGTLKAPQSVAPDDGGVAVHCRFAFEIEDIQEAEVYQVQVSTHAPFSVSQEELKAEDWTVSFTIG